MFGIVMTLQYFAIDDFDLGLNIVVRKGDKEFGISDFYVEDRVFYLEVVDKACGLNGEEFLNALLEESETDDWQNPEITIADCDARLVMSEDFKNKNFKNSLDFKVKGYDNNLILEVL